MTTWSWSHLSTTTEPSLHPFSGLAPDVAHGVVVACAGGSSADQQHLWTLDTANPSSGWTQGPSFPDTYGGRGACWDVINNNVVIFGGQVHLVNNYSQDTYTWDGTTLTAKSPSNLPGKRVTPILGFSHALNAVIMTGGSGPILDYTDTWKWDGSNWHLLSPAHSPDFMLCSHLAPIGDNLYGVAMGGISGTTFETWKFDGTDWTKLTTAHSPPWRVDAGLAAYPTDNLIVLAYGNQAGPGSDSELWQFDGTDWTLISPTNTGPGSNTVSVTGNMCTDPTGTAIIFKDFEAPGGDINQTWSIPPPTFTPPSGKAEFYAQII